MIALRMVMLPLTIATDMVTLVTGMDKLVPDMVTQAIVVVMATVTFILVSKMERYPSLVKIMAMALDDLNMLLLPLA